MTPLRLRMIEDMRIRNLAPQTQTTYVEQVARFARHFHQSPELLGPAEIRTWQLHLTQEKRLAASSISVAVAALRFLYTVTLRRTWVVEDDIPAGRLPRKLPDVLCRAARNSGLRHLPCNLGIGVSGADDATPREAGFKDGWRRRFRRHEHDGSLGSGARNTRHRHRAG